ncbi:MAG: RHS repeat-associated core domain-containing protein [Verrucomicrobiota bacterium]
MNVFKYFLVCWSLVAILWYEGPHAFAQECACEDDKISVEISAFYNEASQQDQLFLEDVKLKVGDSELAPVFAEEQSPGANRFFYEWQTDGDIQPEVPGQLKVQIPVDEEIEVSFNGVTGVGEYAEYAFKTLFFAPCFLKFEIDGTVVELNEANNYNTNIDLGPDNSIDIRLVENYLSDTYVILDQQEYPNGGSLDSFTLKVITKDEDEGDEPGSNASGGSSGSYASGAPSGGAGEPGGVTPPSVFNRHSFSLGSLDSTTSAGSLSTSMRQLSDSSMASESTFHSGIVSYDLVNDAVTVNTRTIATGVTAIQNLTTLDTHVEVREGLLGESDWQGSTLSTGSFEMIFYPTPYNPSDSPLAVWRYDQIGSGSTVQLQVTRIDQPNTSEQTTDVTTYENVDTPTDEGWRSVTQNGDKTEEFFWRYVDDEAYTKIIRIYDNRNSTTLVAETQTTYQYHSSEIGWVITQEIEDPLGANLITTWTYEDDTLSPAFGQLLSVENSDGTWEAYQYDSTGELMATSTPWKDTTLLNADLVNGSNCIKEVSSYDSGTETRITETYIEGIKTKQSDRSSLFVSPNYQTTEKEYFSDGSFLTTFTLQENVSSRRTLHVDDPEGTRTSYEYETGTWNAGTGEFVADPPGTSSWNRGPDLRKLTKNGTVSSPDGIADQSTWQRSIFVDEEAGLSEQLIYGSGGTEVIETTTSSEEEGDWNEVSKSFSPMLGGKARREQTLVNGVVVSTQIYDKGDLVASTDREGHTTTYTYDGYGRPETETRPSVNGTMVTTYGYDVLGRLETSTTQGGSLSLSSQTTYYPSGEVASRTDASGLVTTYQYSTGPSGNRVETITRPNGKTQITEYHLDGQIKSITGTGVIPEFYDYQVEPNGNLSTTHYIGSSDPTSPRWTRTTYDWLGRIESQSQPAFSGGEQTTNYVYNAITGLLERQERTGLADILYEYDPLARQSKQGLDLAGDDDVLTLASTDRLTETEQRFVKESNTWFRQITTSRYLSDDGITDIHKTISKEQVSGLQIGGLLNKSIFIQDIDNNNATTTTMTRMLTTPGVVTSTTDVPDSSSDQVDVYSNGQLASSTNPSIPAGENAITLYTYDDLDRLDTLTDPRGVKTTYSYYTTSASGGLKGQIQTMITSTNPSSPGPTHNKVRYEYYMDGELGAGQIKLQQNIRPLDDVVLNETRFQYDDLNRLTHQWGSATYPKKYGYNGYGDQTTLETYRAGTGWNSASLPSAFSSPGDITTWNYQPSTGLLTSKIYADNKGTSYTYYDSSLLQTRVWERDSGLTTSYSYNGAGQLEDTTYSDGTTDIIRTYDRAGRLATVQDDAGTHTLTHAFDGGLEQTIISGSGVLSGTTLNPGYDAWGRRNNFAIPTSSISQSMTYNASTGRLSSFAQDANLVTYGYEPESNLIKTMTSNNGSSDVLTKTKTFDTISRMSSFSVNSGTLSLTNDLDALNRRITTNRQDGTYWDYFYNDRNEVVSASQHFSNDEFMPGRNFSYTYDHIGNRLTFEDQSAQPNSGPFDYTANQLNQHVDREVSNFKWITGTADSAAYVTINGNLADRMGPDGAYFSWPLELDPETALLFRETDISIKAKLPAAGGNGETLVASDDGSVITPRSPQGFNYDDDGNLTFDGLWTYTWNAENRLIAVESNAAMPTLVKKKLEFVYDYLGRRIQKKVFNHDGSSYVLDRTRKFLYDGWNMVAELDGSDTLLKSYLWGTDLSGTAQGAGGVGGLLAVTDHLAGKTYYTLSDANGNVINLFDSADGSVAATYEYSPFGQVLRATGPAAQINPFRFSSKYQDDETQLNYYGYRYYSADLGRWLNRDPLGDRMFVYMSLTQDQVEFDSNGDLSRLIEKAESQPYLFVDNSPVNDVDLLGLYIIDVMIETEIKPPDTASGIKSRHSVTIDTTKSKITRDSPKIFNTFGIPGTGSGSLTAKFDKFLSNPCVFKLEMSGTAETVLRGFPFTIGGAPRRNEIIDYDFNFLIDIAKFEVTLSGGHDGYPSYLILFDGKSVYSFRQTTLRALAPPDDDTKVFKDFKFRASNN